MVPGTIQTLRYLLTTELPTALAPAFNSVMAPALGQVSPISQTAVVYTISAVTTGVQVNHSLICEPWRLTLATVGKTCGEAGFRSARLTAQAGETGDVNDGFHEAEMAVKQILKRPVYWAFYKISMKANVVKTMATVSNHDMCGERCGETCGIQKEVLNG